MPKGSSRYLPSKEEFLKYVDFIYREPEAPYAELKAFILKHKLTSRGEGLEVDGDLIDLHSMIQFGVSVKYEFEYFSLPEYTYKNEDELRAFFQLVVKAHNHTRMYDNNGFTPNELESRLQKPQRAKPNNPKSQSNPRLYQRLLGTTHVPVGVGCCTRIATEGEVTSKPLEG